MRASELLLKQREINKIQKMSGFLIITYCKCRANIVSGSHLSQNKSMCHLTLHRTESNSELQVFFFLLGEDKKSFVRFRAELELFNVEGGGGGGLFT